ncbi:MAG: hypothetical protein EA424_27295, partial [Planctomycetaceae bacterium]
MRKSLFRLLRMAMVWTVIVLLSVDAALACRWLRVHRGCRVVPSLRVPVCGSVVTCRTPIQKAGDVWKAPWIDPMELKVPEPPEVPEPEPEVPEPEMPEVPEPEMPEAEPEVPEEEVTPVDEPKEKPEKPVPA